MRPEFSVIIPVHNKLPHLERSVFSVLSQSYSHFELILIDDASTDGSSDKLLDFDDPRIKLLRRDTPGPGGYAARNFGIKHATKNWVCFLDADDEWAADVLSTIAEIIQNDQEVEILCWGWLKAKGNSRKADPYSLKHKNVKVKEFTLTDFFNGPQPMWTGGISITKDLITRAGGFPETGFKRGGDMDTWIRCLWQSKKNLRITKPMTSYYLDSVNMVTKAVDRDVAYSFSSFIMKILDSTTDKKLKKAILYFQNRRIYKILTEKVDGGKSIDYSLLFKMNLGISFYYMCLKLHVKKLLIETRLRKPQL